MEESETIKPNRADQENFARLYGCLFFACELVQKMCDEKGLLKPITKKQLDDIQATCRDAACASNALQSVQDGQRVK